MSKLRAKKIKLLLFDVDGVLTDGKLFFFPAPSGAKQSVHEQSAKHAGQGGFGLHSESFVEAKGFHAHDGAGISLARLGGLKTGLITKRISETGALRDTIEFILKAQGQWKRAVEKYIGERSPGSQ